MAGGRDPSPRAAWQLVLPISDTALDWGKSTLDKRCSTRYSTHVAGIAQLAANWRASAPRSPRGAGALGAGFGRGRCAGASPNVTTSRRSRKKGYGLLTKEAIQRQPPASPRARRPVAGGSQPRVGREPVGDLPHRGQRARAAAEHDPPALARARHRDGRAAARVALTRREGERRRGSVAGERSQRAEVPVRLLDQRLEMVCVSGVAVPSRHGWRPGRRGCPGARRATRRALRSVRRRRASVPWRAHRRAAR